MDEQIRTDLSLSDLCVFSVFMFSSTNYLEIQFKSHIHKITRSIHLNGYKHLQYKSRLNKIWSLSVQASVLNSELYKQFVIRALCQ